VSGALGVAVLGSVLAQIYRGQLSPHLANLPATARDAATSSITASQAVAAKLGPAGQELARLADSSFVHAMHITTLISAAITLLGALVVMRWMPGRAAATRPAPAAAVVPVRHPALASEDRLAEGASVNGEAPLDGAALEGAGTLDGAAALEDAATLDGAEWPQGPASRDGHAAANGAARPGGAAARKG